VLVSVPRKSRTVSTTRPITPAATMKRCRAI
jgi:hypothetical protein